MTSTLRVVVGTNCAKIGFNGKGVGSEKCNDTERIAAPGDVLAKKVSSEISQNPQENTCARECF